MDWRAFWKGKRGKMGKIRLESHEEEARRQRRRSSKGTSSKQTTGLDEANYYFTSSKYGTFGAQKWLFQQVFCSFLRT